MDSNQKDSVNLGFKTKKINVLTQFLHTVLIYKQK